MCNSRLFSASLSFLLVGLMLASVASATTINSTTISGNQITIGGVGFNGTLVVTLNGQNLTIAGSTSTQIVATMNPVPPAGSYRLVVKASKSSTFAYVNIAPLPLIVAQVGMTNLTGPIPTTTLFTPQSSGMFRVSYNVLGLTGCNFSEPAYVYFHWTDDDGAEEGNFSFQGMVVYQGVPSSAATTSTNNVRMMAGAAVRYEIPSRNIQCTPFNLYMTVEQLQ